MRQRFLLLFVLLLIPVFVFAINQNSVYIDSITLLKKSNQNIEESISFHDLDIITNISFINVRDYVQYEMIIQNNTNFDYYLNDKNIEEENFSYQFDYSDTAIIKSHSQKKVLLTVSYDKEVDSSQVINNIFVEKKVYRIPIREYDKDLSHNPQTINAILSFLIIIFIISISVFLFLLSKHKRKIILLLFVVFLLTPIVGNCLDSLFFNLHSSISVVYDNSEEPPKEVVADSKFCVVSGTTISDEKSYYPYVSGMTIDDWNNSTFHSFDLNWNSFINADGSYTNIERIGNTILDSSLGCYYNGVIDIEVHPVFARLINGYGGQNISDTSSSFLEYHCHTTQTVAECFDDISFSSLYIYPKALGTCFLGVTGSFPYSALNQCLNNHGRSSEHSVKPDDLIGDFTYISRNYIMDFGCLSGDSEVEVYDRKKKKRRKKRLRDVTYDDLVLAWDFDKGEYVWIEPFWIMKPKIADEYFLLTFSDGSQLKVIGDHRLYQYDSGRFISAINCDIGMRTINSKGDIIILESREIVHSTIDYCNIITKRHINIFVNGILTSHGINNRYEIRDMKYIPVEREHFELCDFDGFEDYFDSLCLKDVDINYEGNRESTKKKLLEYIKFLIDNKK